MEHNTAILRCLAHASRAEGECAPNPCVGALIVKNNKIIAEGFHKGCGHSHAEVEAFNQCNEDLSEATLYVSLEPCCHQGRTPPCTEKIINSGIKKVFFGLKDPNPIVAGKGQAKLREAHIACEQLSLPEVSEFYRAYVYWHQHKMPFVTAKLAVSADNKIAFANKKPAKITGEACRQLTHQYRKKVDAILTTAETIICDDPQMNVRLDNVTIQKNIYIIDSKARLPLDAKIVETAKSITVFHADTILPEQTNRLKEKNVRCIPVSYNQDGLLLTEMLQKIGEEGIHHLWIEAGNALMMALLKQKLIDEFILYVSDQKLGDQAMGTEVSEAYIRSVCGRVRVEKCQHTGRITQSFD